MIRYGRTLCGKGCFYLVEKIDAAPDGSTTIVGYAIVGPDGTELESFAANELGGAMVELDRIAEDKEATPSAPRMG